MKEFESYSQVYQSKFVAIITRGQKNNTYKFALARSILGYIGKNETIIQKNIENNKNTEIKYSIFADDFLRYYWYQYKFKIRQSHNVNDAPSIIQILEDEIFGKEYRPENFEKVSEKLKENARELALKKVFGKEKQKLSQVVPRFQTIPRESEKDKKIRFYENDEQNERILLNPEAMKFLIRYRVLLDKFVVLEWAKFCDGIRPSPGTASKIEEPKFDRKSLKPNEKILMDHFDTCFYCETKLDEELKNAIHVDHFIPHSYIFNNEIWNLVLSCSQCNLNKSDSLAVDFKKALIERNNSQRFQIKGLDYSLTKLDNGLGWEKEMNRMYDDCYKYWGFTEITREEIKRRK